MKILYRIPVMSVIFQLTLFALFYWLFRDERGATKGWGFFVCGVTSIGQCIMTWIGALTYFDDEHKREQAKINPPRR